MTLSSPPAAIWPRGNGLWIHTGSTPVLGPDGRYLNHSTLINAAGRIVAEYDKIHLFDVAIEGQAPIGESRRFAPGDRAVLAETPWGPFAMSICYDLRFPYLYRAYAQAGAVMMFIPSAFTVPTGRAHWDVLLRARAIETGAFVLAAAQAGHHADGRETWVMRLRSGHGARCWPIWSGRPRRFAFWIWTCRRCPVPAARYRPGRCTRTGPCSGPCRRGRSGDRSRPGRGAFLAGDRFTISGHARIRDIQGRGPSHARCRDP